MFSIFTRHKKKVTAPRSISEIKQSARVLFIDDRKPNLVQDLANEGWRVRYLSDLDKFDNTELLDSHILCLDIVGVGKKLRYSDGMGLVEGLKDRYPSKRVLLYSSVRRHDIFDDAIDLVDARVYKDGQPYQFIRTVEQLALQAFDWEHCVETIYQRYKGHMGKEMSIQEFEKQFRKCIQRNGELDTQRVSKFALVGLDVASKMTQLATYVTSL